MSDVVAAGCARSRFQSVSVVPISQWFFHGMTNSTDVAVRRISPASPVIRSRGTTMCTPLDARTRNRPRPPDSACISSVHTPVQLSTTPAATGRLAAVLGVAHLHPDDPVGLAQEADRPASRCAPPRRTGRRCGPPSACAGRRRPGRRSSAPRRPARRLAGPGNTRSAARRVTGASARAGCCGRPSCRRAAGPRRRTAAPRAGGSADTGTAPA